MATTVDSEQVKAAVRRRTDESPRRYVRRAVVAAADVAALAHETTSDATRLHG